MNILVTAGNTQIPIDRVRCITNIFSGRTGALLAEQAFKRNHAVTLLTSHPEIVAAQASSSIALHSYRTFDDLLEQLSQRVVSGSFDAIVHCAAVSDFRVNGVYAPAAGTRFDEDTLMWEAKSSKPKVRDLRADKIKSDEGELWLRLQRTPKLIDLIRSQWQFTGILVKFKLEVGITDDQLLHVAEQARQASNADLMVANTLEGMHDWAYLGPLSGGYHRIPRNLLPARLFDEVERLHSERQHG